MADQPKPPLDKLRDAVLTMDLYSQTAFDRIEAIASVTRAAAAQMLTETRPGFQRGFLLDLGKTLETIEHLASEAQNDINCAAEDVGCAYKEEPSAG